MLYLLLDLPDAHHQLLILNRGRKRAPNLRSADRVMASLCMLFIRRARLLRFAIVLKPSTLLQLHRVLTKRKYRLLFSPRPKARPGPKGATKELIDRCVWLTTATQTLFEKNPLESSD